MVRALAIAAALLAAIAFLPPLVADLFGYRTSPDLVPRNGRIVGIGEGRFLHVVEEGTGPPVGGAVTRDVLIDAFATERAVPPGWVDYTRASLELPGSFRAMTEEGPRSDPGSLRRELLTMPALVIHGTEDRLVPYSVAEHLDALLPVSRLETVFDGSHMLPVAHPKLIAQKRYELARGGFILESAQ